MNALQAVVRSTSRLVASRVLSLARCPSTSHHPRALSTATTAWTVETPSYTAKSSANVEPVEPAGANWAFGMLAVILSANIFAIWAELQMSPKESLLQGLAEAGKSHQQQRAKNDDTHGRRRARIIHFRLPGQ